MAVSDEVHFDALFKHWWRHSWSPDLVSSPFSPEHGWAHTPTCATENLLYWVCGGLYWCSSAKERNNKLCHSSLLLWKPKSPEKLSFVSVVWVEKMRKALVGHLLLWGALWSKTYSQEYSSESCMPSSAECYGSVTSVSRCHLGEACPEPQSTAQLLTALTLGCNHRLAGDSGCCAPCAPWRAWLALVREYLLSG